MLYGHEVPLANFCAFSFPKWIHQMITSLAVYAMFHILPRNQVQLVVPAFVMIYMTLGHLHRQYINYLGWDLDFTGAQMVCL